MGGANVTVVMQGVGDATTRPLRATVNMMYSLMNMWRIWCVSCCISLATNARNTPGFIGQWRRQGNQRVPCSCTDFWTGDSSARSPLLVCYCRDVFKLIKAASARVVPLWLLGLSPHTPFIPLNWMRYRKLSSRASFAKLHSMDCHHFNF